MRRAVVVTACVALGACGGTSPGARGGGTSNAPHANAAASSSGNASGNGGAGASSGSGTPGAGTRTSGFDVAGSADAGSSTTFDVTGSSDLPSPVPSTAQPFARMVDSAVAPLRPALAECLRPLGTGRRLFRVVVGLDGVLSPRPPQPYEVPPRVATCVQGVLHATTIDPPPPREYPYDIYVSVAPP